MTLFADALIRLVAMFETDLKIDCFLVLLLLLRGVRALARDALVLDDISNFVIRDEPVQLSDLTQRILAMHLNKNVNVAINSCGTI